MSKIIRDPKVVSNRNSNSNLKQATQSEVKDSKAECIVRYLSFVKSFSLDCEQYSEVEDQVFLSTDTTFEICEGLYFTDTSYQNESLI